MGAPNAYLARMTQYITVAPDDRVEARNGVMLSLLAQATDPSPEAAAAAYRAVMEGVVSSIGGSPDRSDA